MVMAVGGFGSARAWRGTETRSFVHGPKTSDIISCELVSLTDMTEGGLNTASQCPSE